MIKKTKKGHVDQRKSDGTEAVKRLSLTFSEFLKIIQGLIEMVELFQ